MDIEIDPHLKSLIEAIDEGDAAAAASALAAGADPNGRDPQENWTPAMLACRGFPREAKEAWMDERLRGRAQCLRLLLAAGADPNAKSPLGWSPACWAARDGSLDSLRALMDAGADVATGNGYGTTPLEMACASGETLAAEMVISHIGVAALGEGGLRAALVASAAMGRAGPAQLVCERALALGFDVERWIEESQPARGWRLGEDWRAGARAFVSSWRERVALEAQLSDQVGDASAPLPSRGIRM